MPPLRSRSRPASLPPIPSPRASPLISSPLRVRPASISPRKDNDSPTPPRSDSSLVFAPEGGYSGASLVAALAGDGSSSDITALYSAGTGRAGQIAYGDWCVSARGVVPGSASQTLFVEACSDDPAQVWTVNADPMTVSNADGNCVTLGRAWVDVPVSTAFFAAGLLVGGLSC